MFNTTNGYSLSDISTALGNSANGRGLFGTDGSWWIIILFLFCFVGGWGNGGFGGNGGCGINGITAALDANTTRSTLTEGLYTLNTGILTNFATTNAAISNGIDSIHSSICDSNMANAQNVFGLTNQLNNIGSMLQQNHADINYNLASQACQNRQLLNENTRDIIDNQNNNTRSILDFLVKDKIDTLNAENAALRSQVSQTEQNAYLVSQLGAKVPQAAYIVANPYTGTAYTSYGLGIQSTCGCTG